jgi:hypothetical protein
MNTRLVMTFVTGAAAAALCATCAPVDVPDGDTARAPAAAAALPAPEPLPTPPGRPDGLRARVEAAIQQTRERDLLTSNGFWTVFHGILGLGPEVMLLNPETGARVKALDYIAGGGELRGLRFIPTRDGLDVQTGPTFVGQGHQDQFIAEMAQWGVSPDLPFTVNGKDYTYMDFVRHTRARARVTADQELSWAIVILGQFFGTEGGWINAAGEAVRFEDVVRYEMKASVNDAPCGGTHRLFGLSWVYHLHLRRGGRKEGLWQEVAEHTARYQRLARELQNRDGSFSTNFFRGPGNATDRQLRLNTTGHIFEWLALSLSDQELQEQWVRDAANTLALMFLEIQGAPMEGGTLYHAVHGLIIYYGRVHGTAWLGPQAPHVPLPPGSRELAPRYGPG